MINKLSLHYLIFYNDLYECTSVEYRHVLVIYCIRVFPCDCNRERLDITLPVDEATYQQLLADEGDADAERTARTDTSDAAPPA